MREPHRGQSSTSRPKLRFISTAHARVHKDLRGTVSELKQAGEASKYSQSPKAARIYRKRQSRVESALAELAECVAGGQKLQDELHQEDVVG